MGAMAVARKEWREISATANRVLRTVLRRVGAAGDGHRPARNGPAPGRVGRDQRSARHGLDSGAVARPRSWHSREVSFFERAVADPAAAVRVRNAGRRSSSSTTAMPNEWSSSRPAEVALLFNSIAAGVEPAGSITCDRSSPTTAARSRIRAWSSAASRRW